MGFLMYALSPSSSSVVGHMLAHQGGWDEMLMVAVPVGIFAGLLYAANRRAARLSEHDDRTTERPPKPEPRNERGGPI